MRKMKSLMSGKMKTLCPKENFILIQALIFLILFLLKKAKKVKLKSGEKLIQIGLYNMTGYIMMFQKMHVFVIYA